MSNYAQMRKYEEQRSWIGQLVSSAQARKWYGKMTFIMEYGDIKQVVKEESLKPPTGKN